MNEPWHTRDSGAHRFEWSDPERLIFEFDLIRTERSGEVTAEVLVTSTAPAIGGTIHHARLNLVSTRSRAEVAKHLATRAPSLSVGDWPQLLEYACRETVLAYRAGAPAMIPLEAISCSTCPRTSAAFQPERRAPSRVSTSRAAPSRSNPPTRTGCAAGAGVGAGPGSW